MIQAVRYYRCISAVERLVYCSTLSCNNSQVAVARMIDKPHQPFSMTNRGSSNKYGLVLSYVALQWSGNLALIQPVPEVTLQNLDAASEALYEVYSLVIGMDRCCCFLWCRSCQ